MASHQAPADAAGPAGPAQLAQAGDVNLPACTSAFDALWFCYSPPNQMKKYYREGTYDDCEAHSRLFELCMRLRFREVNGKGSETSSQDMRNEMLALSTKTERPDHVWKFKPVGQGEGAEADAAAQPVPLTPPAPAAATGGWASWFGRGAA